MKKFKLFIITILCLFLMGCAGKHDINQLVLVSAIGIDKTEDGFQLVAQIVNKNILVPEKPQITPIFLITVEGETVFDCLKNVTDLLPNRPFLINLQLLVFSDEIAKEGIGEYVRFFITNSEAHHEYNIMLTKDVTAEEVLGQISMFSMFPTRILIKKLETAKNEYGFAKETFLEELISSIDNPLKTLTLSSVSVSGDLEEGANIDQNKTSKIDSKIVIDELGVFKRDKLVGWLTKDESVTLNFVLGKIKKAVLVVEGMEDNKISTVINNVKSKRKFEIINNKPKVTVEISFDAVVTEDTKQRLKLEKDYVEDVEKKLEQKLSLMIDEIIKKSKNELEVDIFNFSNDFYKRQPKWWKENGENYNHFYSELEFEVTVKPNVKRLEF